MPPKKSKNKSTAFSIFIGLFILGIILVTVYFTVIQPKSDATPKEISTNEYKDEKKIPVDGKLSDWSEWSKCNKECGPGEQIRTRIYTAPSNGGKDPIGYDKLKESKPCEIKPCPINAKLTNWQKEGTCVRFDDKITPIDCGSGTQKLIRKYLPALYGGIDTISYEDRNTLEKWEDCKLNNPCPKATVSSWINIKDNNKGYTETDNTINYYYINNNNKIYITDKDKNKICYDKTIKIGNNNLTVANIKYDQIRKFTPGGSSTRANEETMDLLIKDLQNKGEIESNEISNIKKTKIQKQTISLQSNSKEILPCTQINEACSAWKESGTCQCKDNKYQKKQVRTYTAPKYGGTTPIKGPQNCSLEKWIQCDNGICPSDGKLTDFAVETQPGENSNDKCLPDYGKNRKKKMKAIYTFPFINTKHNEYIQTNFSTYFPILTALQQNQSSNIYLDTDQNEVQFIRINNTKPEKFEIIKFIKCSDLGRISKLGLNTLWKKETGCNIDLTDSILSKVSSKKLEEYEYDIDTTNFTKNIEPWYKKEILQYTLPNNNRSIMKNNIDILKDCYSQLPLVINKDNLSQYYSTNNIIKKNIIYPGIDYTNDAFWETFNYRLKINFQGNLDIIHITKNIKLWEQNANPTSTGTILSMQNDGNLVLYKDLSKKNVLWKSDTNTPGSYAELLEIGSNTIKTISYPLLVIKDNSGKIVKKINPIEIINKKSTWANIYNNLSTKYPLAINKNDDIIFTDSHIIHPSIYYYKNFKWTNGDFRLDLNNDLHAIIFDKNNNWIFNTNTSNNSDGYFVLQNDGNLVIYDNINNQNAKWSSNTNGFTVPYAELTSKGYLILNNQNLNVLKAFPENIIEAYLMKDYWNNSPWTLFSDKKKRVWRATWSDLDTDFDKSKLQNEGCPGVRCQFRGIWKDSSNSQWNVGSIDITNVNGYKNEDQGHKPIYKDDNDDYNYNEKEHRSNFSPLSLGGYYRISKISNSNSMDGTEYFLISDRGDGRDKQAFVLHKIITDKKEFAKDMIEYNKELIKKIINNDGKLKQIIKDYTGKDDFSYDYRDKILKPQYGISSFTNKNEFYNISNFYNKQNYNISKIHDIEYFISSKKIKPRPNNNKNNFNNKLHTSYLEMINY